MPSRIWSNSIWQVQIYNPDSDDIVEDHFFISRARAKYIYEQKKLDLFCDGLGYEQHGEEHKGNMCAFRLEPKYKSIRLIHIEIGW